VLSASMAGSKGMPGFGVYAASKAAVRSFARSWAVDLKERKIRVNAVSAGVIPTPGYESGGLTREQIEGFAAQMAPLIPLGRVGTPEEVAQAVLFLASAGSSFVNGVELFVDGGMAQV
jgi:NAD(P)-dependent dehydrogenase (short-subunit alcohol dehydrogenase family)